MAINSSSANNNDQLRAFFDNSKLGYLYIDLAGNITSINNVINEITGFTKEELTGKHFNILIEEGYHKNVDEILKKLSVIKNGNLECEFKTKQNENLYAILNFIILCSDDNKPLGAAILVENISKYKKTIDYLSNQTNLFQRDIENTISKFTTLVSNSRDVLYSIYYQKFIFEYLSPSILEITGYTHEEVLSMSFKDILKIIHADYREMYKKYWKSLLYQKDRLNHTVEYKIRPKEGISRWLSDNHKLIFDNNGNLVKVVGNIRDITDFKLVEDALSRSRDRLYKAIEATNDGMWDWRLNTNKIYFDARFYSILGYEPLEFPPTIEEWMNRIHPEDIEQARNLLNEHLGGKSDQWLIEYRFKAKNNEYIWVLNRGKVFERDAEGKPLRMVGTHSDISLRKKAEAEVQKRNEELQVIYDQLQISEERFRQLAENTDDVFLLRDDKQVLYVNSAFDRIWGHSCMELLKNPKILKEWVHPDDQASFDPWLPFSNFENEKIHIEQYRIINPHGEIRWLWSRTFPVYNDLHKIYRIAGIISDITDQKNIEEALIAAKEKALESDRLKSAFLANISHEIRTPMNGIIGFAELLKEENLSIDNRLQYVNIITKSSEQLLHIIDDIIDISKIEANQLNTVKTTCSLVNLINELQIFYENEKVHMGKEQIQIITEIDTTTPEVVVITDESRLRQILMNLISNAVKFTVQGHVKFGFHIRTKLSIDFFVEDTGIGIANDMQTLIFKRFRQLDDSLTRKFGGTGLGLAICEGLVKLLGGKIWVKSEKEKGSTFFFTLPYIKDIETKVKEPRETDKSDSFDWSDKTIMVVEDDNINQEFLNAILIPTNVNVLFASSGEDAVQLCNTENNIDLILMDIRLPKMNGYEAFELIRKKKPNIKVIAQTAFAMTDDAQKCIQLGFSDYIAKPIMRKQILIMINKHLH
jgi:PAS domain S-box-containing protein